MLKQENPQFLPLMLTLHHAQLTYVNLLVGHELLNVALKSTRQRSSR